MKLSERLSAVCFIDRPIQRVEEALTGFLAKFGEVRRSELQGHASVAEYLSPLLSFGTRHVLVETGDWSLLVDNQHGGGPSDLAVVLGTRGRDRHRRELAGEGSLLDRL